MLRVRIPHWVRKTLACSSTVEPGIVNPEGAGSNPARSAHLLDAVLGDTWAFGPTTRVSTWVPFRLILVYTLVAQMEEQPVEARCAQVRILSWVLDAADIKLPKQGGRAPGVEKVGME